MATDTRVRHFMLMVWLLVQTTTCQEIGNSKRQVYILNKYRGLFFTKAGHERQAQCYVETRNEMLTSQGYDSTSKTFLIKGDGDSCCQTHITYSIPYVMEDINGVSQSIVQFPYSDPPMYQFVRNVSCSTLNVYCKIEQCFIEPSFISLLVNTEDDDENDSITFAWFQVPGYCSCKNISL